MFLASKISLHRKADNRNGYEPRNCHVELDGDCSLYTIENMVTILDACQFHWSNMRIVWAANNPSPDRSLQIASRRWYSGHSSEPTKCNTMFVDKYI
jgi:hypothetical protein